MASFGRPIISDDIPPRHEGIYPIVVVLPENEGGVPRAGLWDGEIWRTEKGPDGWTPEIFIVCYWPYRFDCVDDADQFASENDPDW